MPSADPWIRLDLFDDPSIPKLHNLKTASRAGFVIPETVWAKADVIDLCQNMDIIQPPCIVRSGSPTEDTHTTSNAGQLLSLVVESPDDFADAVARVVAALPREQGRPLGVVFVQPLIRGGIAGVTFFDGFYFEETRADGSNSGLTSGIDRGEVRRGHVQRGDPWHAWLVRLQRLFGGRIDVEWATDPINNNKPVLLQVRPALFPIKRSQTISLANHKEILGDPPSPWMVGLLAEVGRPVMSFFERVDPEVATWDEPYAIELGERAWMNFSAFFRLMDHWGLPRSMVTEGVGGEKQGPLDDRVHFLRIIQMSPTLIRKALGDYRAMFAIKRGLRELDTDLAQAHTLSDLWLVNTRALAFSIQVNFAVNSLLAIASKVRRKLGLAQAGRVVTHEMMTAYAELASRPNQADRLAGLDAWLARHGHRGPLESDPSQPRFLELRDTLRAGLTRGPAAAPVPGPRPSWLVAAIARPFFIYDEVREWFRDALMRWWQRLRLRILEEAQVAVDRGWIKAIDDIFLLRGPDLAADPATWQSRVEHRRALWNQAKALDLTSTASRDQIETEIQANRVVDESTETVFRGIGLGSRLVEGTAVRASDLRPLLDGRDLPTSPILVVPTLEPSWAVVFPRFAAVVVELGGELSHASILLREARIPAIVNARGAYRAIQDGDRLAVDPIRGEVRKVTTSS